MYHIFINYIPNSGKGKKIEALENAQDMLIADAHSSTNASTEKFLHYKQVPKKYKKVKHKGYSIKPVSHV